MALRILSAWFRKNGIEKKIDLSELTDEEYEKKYVGHLFCPNRNCNARIIFASGNQLKYFRTHPARIDDGMVVNEHIDDCPYFVEHEIEERARRRKDPNILYSISQEHMRRVLKKAYERQVNPEKFKKDPQPPDGVKKRASSATRTDLSLQPAGRAGLGIDGAVAGSEKEPSIYQKFIDDISDKDYLETQCIVGEVKDMVTGNDYTYINLNTKNNRKARILFSEAAAVNSPGMKIGTFKDYIDFCNIEGQTPIICSIGRITKDEYEISVVIEDYHAILINGMGYYGLLNTISA